MSVKFSFSFSYSADVLLICVPFLSISLSSSFRTAGLLKYKLSGFEIESVCVYIYLYTHTHIYTNLKCVTQSLERIYTLHCMLSINTMYL